MYLGRDGHFILMYNIRAMFRILCVTRSLMCYTRPILWGQRSSVCLCMREAQGEAGLSTGYVYEAIARADVYVHRIYSMQDKAGH